VETYAVTGATPSEISLSINQNGPYSDWIGGAAQGMTETDIDLDVAYRTSGEGDCTVVLGNVPVSATYTIVLPAWTPSPGTPAWTVAWWNEALRETAVHERTHVEIYRRGLADLAAALATATCSQAAALVDETSFELNRENCEFDMNEYGTRIGLTMESCLSGGSPGSANLDLRPIAALPILIGHAVPRDAVQT